MSQVLINNYLAELDRIKKASGSLRESVVREAFKDLLKAWGRQQDLQFVSEYELDTKTCDRRYVDGALLHALRVPFGYWEAKDEADDLDAEIALKFKRGYPQDNIVFEDSRQAVLIQRREEVMRCSVTDVAQLEKLLKLFFSHERPEIAGFRRAVEQFKTDLPAVLAALREMIERQQADNPAFRKAAKRFLKHAQEAINPRLTAADVREMLIQHVLTEEIFAKVFDDSDFHRKNNVAHALYRLEETFFTGGLKRDTLKGLVGPEMGVFILIVVVIGGFRWMPVARLVRAQFLSLREKEFVEAARALGATTGRQVVRHILPNAMGPVVVAGTIDVAAAIIAESTLSFLGLGFPPDIPTWGRLLYDAKDYLDIAPHWALFPGSAIFLAVLSINFIGDGLRDALDPRKVM